jgi:glycosyltransferase involved in cell wall biosynthesis
LPTRDRGYCLERAVGSVVAQDIDDWELILVDDGSTDCTPQLRRRFSDMLGSKYRDLESGGKGASAARNAGLAVARGDYIAFLDSDDFWLPEKLGMQVEAMRSCEAAGLCFTDYAEIDSSGRITRREHTIAAELNGNAYPALLDVDHNCVTTPSVMIRKDILEKAGGFDETMHICEDIDLWARIARIAPVIPIRIPLSVVHIRPCPVFPYERSIVARAELYSRAVSRDPSLKGPVLCRLHRGLLRCYHDAAAAWGDHHQKAILAETIEIIDESGVLSPQELEQLYLYCAKRCAAAASGELPRIDGRFRRVEQAKSTGR